MKACLNRSVRRLARGIVLFVVILLSCCGGSLIFHKAYWWYQKYDVVNIVKANKYPTAMAVNTEVGISRGMTSDWCWVTAYVTFRANVSFERVSEWYKLHPEGVVYAEGGSGLDLLKEQAGTIEYGVRYQRVLSALVCPGDEP